MTFTMAYGVLTTMPTAVTCYRSCCVLSRRYSEGCAVSMFKGSSWLVLIKFCVRNSMFRKFKDQVIVDRRFGANPKRVLLFKPDQQWILGWWIAVQLWSTEQQDYLRPGMIHSMIGTGFFRTGGSRVDSLDVDWRQGIDADRVDGQDSVVLGDSGYWTSAVISGTRGSGVPYLVSGDRPSKGTAAW